MEMLQNADNFRDENGENLRWVQEQVAAVILPANYTWAPNKKVHSKGGGFLANVKKKWKDREKARE